MRRLAATLPPCDGSACRCSSSVTNQLAGRSDFWMCFFVLYTFCRANTTYSRHDILMIGIRLEGKVTQEFIHSHKIPVDVARSPGSPWITIGGGGRGSRSGASEPAR